MIPDEAVEAAVIEMSEGVAVCVVLAAVILVQLVRIWTQRRKATK